MDIWWFKLQGLCEEAVGELDMDRVRTAGEPDAHRGRARHAPRASQTRTTGEPDAHHKRARRAPRVHYGRVKHAPRAHQMGFARAPDLGGADEG